MDSTPSRVVKIVVTVAALLVAAGSLSPAAAAADKVPLGGGAGIIVEGVEGAEDRGSLASVVAADEGLHYAVIRFDPAKTAAVADFDGFAIEGVGADPGSIQPACTQGAATGFNCGFTTVADVRPGAITAMMPTWQPGDDGAPVTVDGQLVGMTRKGHIFIVPGTVVFPGGNAKISVVLFSAILDDVNAYGGPGAGFTPAAA
jgi:hypothetical protein